MPGLKSSVVKNPTCSENGIGTLLCLYCQQPSQEYTIYSTGHTSDGEWGLCTPASCIDAGIEALYCTGCGTILDRNIGEALGHIESEERIVVSPTCVSEGVSEVVCLVCNAMLNRIVVPPTGHEDGNWVVTREATTDTEGLREMHCLYCDTVLRTEPIDIIQ